MDRDEEIIAVAEIICIRGDTGHGDTYMPGNLNISNLGQFMNQPLREELMRKK